MDVTEFLFNEIKDLGLTLKRGALLHARGATLVECFEIMLPHAKFDQVKTLIKNLRTEFTSDNTIQKTLKSAKGVPSTVIHILEIGFLAGIMDRAMDESAGLLLMDQSQETGMRVASPDLPLYFHLRRINTLLRFGLPVEQAVSIAEEEEQNPETRRSAHDILARAHDGEFVEDKVSDEVGHLKDRLEIKEIQGFSRPDSNPEADFRFQRWIFYRRVLDELHEGKKIRPAMAAILEETEDPRLHHAIQYVVDSTTGYSIYEAMAMYAEEIFTFEEVMFMEVAERTGDALDGVQALLEIMRLEFVHGYYQAQSERQEYVRSGKPILTLIK